MPPVENDTGKTELKSRIQQLIDTNQVIVFSKSYCPYCVKVRYLFYRPGGKRLLWPVGNFQLLPRSNVDRARSNYWRDPIAIMQPPTSVRSRLNVKFLLIKSAVNNERLCIWAVLTRWRTYQVLSCSDTGVLAAYLNVVTTEKLRNLSLTYQLIGSELYEKSL